MNPRYDTSADFLPEKGVVYVDTCGLTFAAESRHRDEKYEIAELRKLANFNREFRKRGRILTAPLVLQEIGLRERQYRHLKNGRRKRNHGAPREAEETRRNPYRRIGLREFRRAYEFLKEGVRTNPLRREIATAQDIGQELERFEELSEADKELVSSATNEGPGNGILTADTPMMNAYRRMVEIFSINGCFICNCRRSITEIIS